MNKFNNSEKANLQEIFYEPAKLLIRKLEEKSELLNIEEIIMLEKLKFSLKMYELKQAQREQRAYNDAYKDWGI